MEDIKYDINNENCKGYKITKDGRIWSDKTNIFLSTKLTNGYLLIQLNKVNLTVHRLVAETFIPNPDDKPYVNHINSNKIDNRVENLEWVTQKENCNAHGKSISHPKRVIQSDMQGKIINTYDSLIEAGASIGLSPSSISKAVLKINMTAGGYVWDYEQDTMKVLDISKGKQIYGNPKYYIFPDGIVYNYVRKCPLKPILNASGYCYVTISNNKTKKNHYVHRLVAEHFIENNDKNKTQVNHKNKKKDDNRIENLEWIIINSSQNSLHAKFSELSL